MGSVFERIEDGKLSVAKATFGAEPKDYEVQEYIQKYYFSLKFSPAVETIVKDIKRNPKRMQREAKKQMLETGIGTKSQQALKLQQEQNAREITIEDRAVKDGDILTIDYSGSVDGVKFEGGTAEDQTLVIGSGAFIPGFEEQLVGKNLNETADINVTFPEEYHAPDLAGKDAVFTVTVKAIKEKELPELDDEFAAEVSEFETLEDYKADIKEKIRDRKKEAANTERENKIVDAAVEAATMDIPEAMIEEQVQQMTDEFAQRLSYQGLSMEQYLMFSGMDAQKFADDLKPQAVKRIETRLVLEAIAKAEDITASEEDFKAELEKMAGMYQMETEQLEKIIQGAQKDQMMDDIAVQKAVDFLVGEAK